MMWKNWALEKSVQKPAGEGVTENEGHNEHYYLGPINSTSQNDDEWTVTLDIVNKPVKFKNDSGADCSVLSETVYKTLGSKKILRKTSKVPVQIVLYTVWGSLSQTVNRGKTYILDLCYLRQK